MPDRKQNPTVQSAAASTNSEHLTHIDEHGRALMVDVSGKDHTRRKAIAEASIFMKPETLSMISEGSVGKGDVFACARIAGIMAAKRCADMIPLCHPIPLTDAKVELESFCTDTHCGIRVLASCSTTGQTGIEMEALCAASVACLTMYDMCKAADRSMEITQVRLLKKEGGRSGLWERDSS